MAPYPTWVTLLCFTLKTQLPVKRVQAHIKTNTFYT